MSDHRVTEKLIYLDTDFVSRLYEDEKGVSTKTTIIRSQTLEASASIALFSGGGSTMESRSYEISSTQMLSEIRKRLEKYEDFEAESFKKDSPSAYFWVDGVLTISKIKVTRTHSTITLAGPPKSNEQPSKQIVGEEAYFCIKGGDFRFALSASDQFFVPGVAAFKGMAHIAIKQLGLPCRALIRVFSAETNAKEWLATPLIIYDADC